MSLDTSSATRLAGLIRDAGSVVALTGAGISVPSGIPDFRSPGTGLWRNRQPEHHRLHAKAGTGNLIEVHGTIDHSSCVDCGARYPLADVRAGQRADEAGVPRCDCGRPLKPDVVLFGDYLPVEALAHADRLAAGADLMLCIGSSLEVYPVAHLPDVSLSAGGQVVIITQGATPFDARAAVRCDGDVVQEMNAVLAALGIDQR